MENEAFGDAVAVDDADNIGVARLPTLLQGSTLSILDDDEGHAPGTSLDEDPPTSHLLPAPPERTLKEKLVERERQKRIETERARLMRQFALSNGAVVEESLEEASKGVQEDGSVIGTVGGGSSVAATAAMDINDEKQSEKLGYAMERFLSESGQVVAPNGSGSETDLKQKAQSEAAGVVMERFLSEPVVVSQIVVEAPDILDEPSPSVDFDSTTQLPHVLHAQQSLAVTFDDSHVVQSTPSNDMPTAHSASEVGENASISSVDHVHPHLTANDSMDVNSHSAIEIGTLADLDSFNEHQMNLLSSGALHSHRQEASSSISSLHSVDQQASTDQPTRVLRLTEREIQEMEAIEEASIGNAPPSEREDTLSEVGDMTSLFQDPVRDMDPRGGFSINTLTTESVSNTSVGGNQSRGEQSQEEAGDTGDAHSIDGIAAASVSSHLAVSPSSSEGRVSVTANPPSVTADDDPVDEIISPTLDNHLSVEPAINDLAVLPALPVFDHDDSPLDAEESARANAGVVNRRLRPGLTMTPPRELPTRHTPNSSEMKRTLSMPEKMHVTLDGFDYDKYDFIPTSPHSNADNSFQDLSNGLWGPDEAMMVISPLQTRKLATPALDHAQDIEQAQLPHDIGDVFRKNYGALDDVASQPLQVPHASLRSIEFEHSDRTPLLSQSLSDAKVASTKRSLAESVFSSIRSDSPLSLAEEANDASQYKISGMLARAFPERFLALFVTLLVEIPVLFMVAGGSDRLCMLIGRRRYELLMAFLPLSSAISGNCGLQASTLTTRAISHDQVTVANFQDWLKTEVGAATFLAFGMGLVLGVCAYMISGFDIAFGITIFVAQFISLVTAGFTGTLAPLIFTFIFHRDSGKWGGPLETAIQDIVGSFAMVVVSYHILVLFGPHVIAPSDMCGGGD